MPAGSPGSATGRVCPGPGGCPGHRSRCRAGGGGSGPGTASPGLDRTTARRRPCASIGCSGTPVPAPSGRSAGPASGPVTSRSGRSPAGSRRWRRSHHRGRGKSRRSGCCDVIHDVVVPAQRLVPVEMPAHDQAATPAQQRLRLGRDGARLDARVVDDRPDRLTAQPRRGDLLGRCLDLLLDDGERFLGGAPEAAMRARSAALICRMARADPLVPAPSAQRGQRGDLGLGLDRHGSTPSRNVSLLRRSLGWLQPSRQDSLLESAHGPGQAFAALLRSLTDEHVLRTLMRQRRMTRAELAAETGISKPAVGESVRRLAEAGLVADTGQRTAAAAAAAESLVLRPGRRRWRVPRRQHRALGIVAECVDAYGGTVSRAERSISRPARPGQVPRRCKLSPGRRTAAPGRPPGWPW